MILSRMTPLLRLGKALPEAVLCGNASRSYRRVPFVPPTVSELPVPEGSWDRAYKRNNEKYSKHLILGLSFFAITLGVVSRVATFNFYPPPVPGVIDDMCPVILPEEKKC